MEGVHTQAYRACNEGPSDGSGLLVLSHDALFARRQCVYEGPLVLVGGRPGLQALSAMLRGTCSRVEVQVGRWALFSRLAYMSNSPALFLSTHAASVGAHTLIASLLPHQLTGCKGDIKGHILLQEIP